MNPERKDFLNLRTKPGRFTSEEAAWFLGFHPHEIPMLMGARLLEPLGDPAENGCKYFGIIYLERLKQDISWQAKASNAVVKYWKDRNLQRPTESAKKRWPKKAIGAGRVTPTKKLPLRLIPPPKK
jgi:hypothetical protein